MNKILLLLITVVCFGETPPPRDINARLYDKDNNGLTSTLNTGKRSLDVNITSALGSVTVSNFPATQAVTQSTSPWVIGGTIDIGNFPATFGVTQSTSPWLVSGTVTANIGTSGALALDATLSALSAKFGSLGQKTMSGSAPVVIASDQSAIPVSGTITANQGTTPWTENVSQFGGSNVVTGVGSSGAGIPRVTVSSDSSITNITGTVSLPTGAATETSLAKLTQSQASTTSGQQGPLVQGATTTNQPTYTTGQTNPLSLNTRGALRSKSTGFDASTIIRNVYSTTNVTTSAYVQLVASTSMDINRLHIFDSSGQDLVLAVGPAASEVDQIQIFPGGIDADLFIPAGSRISVKAVSATANAGILAITGLK